MPLGGSGMYGGGASRFRAAAVLGHATFHVFVEGLCLGQAGPGGEEGLRCSGSEFLAVFGRARLHDDGVALGGALDIERPLHFEVLAHVVQGV